MHFYFVSNEFHCCTYYDEYDFAIDSKLNLTIHVSGTHDDESNEERIEFDKTMKLTRAHTNLAVREKAGTSLNNSAVSGLVTTEMNKYLKGLSKAEFKSALDMKILATAKNGTATEALYTMTTFKVKEGSYRTEINQHQCLNVFVLSTGSYKKVVTDCVRGEYYVKGLPLK